MSSICLKFIEIDDSVRQKYGREAPGAGENFFDKNLMLLEAFVSKINQNDECISYDEGLGAKLPPLVKTFYKKLMLSKKNIIGLGPKGAGPLPLHLPSGTPVIASLLVHAQHQLVFVLKGNPAFVRYYSASKVLKKKFFFFCKWTAQSTDHFQNNIISVNEFDFNSSIKHCLSCIFTIQNIFTL